MKPSASLFLPPISQKKEPAERQEANALVMKMDDMPMPPSQWQHTTLVEFLKRSKPLFSLAPHELKGSVGFTPGESLDGKEA